MYCKKHIEEITREVKENLLEQGPADVIYSIVKPEQYALRAFEELHNFIKHGVATPDEERQVLMSAVEKLTLAILRCDDRTREWNRSARKGKGQKLQSNDESVTPSNSVTGS